MGLLLVAGLPGPVRAAEPALENFTKEIQPILDKYCYDCHGFGVNKGGVQLDDFASDAGLRDHQLWLRALKNLRSGIMPPVDEPRVPAELLARLEQWIKRDALSLDPRNPDPGRVTVRRLNRVEYRNTIHALLGVDFDTQKEFPPDDTGHGFDNLGDVLTISPMLLEKYLDAAQTIVTSTVPTKPRTVAEQQVDGRLFFPVKPEAGPVVEDGPKPGAAGPATPAVEFKRPAPAVEGKTLDLSYYTPVTVAAGHQVAHAGKYELAVDLRALERYVDDQFDYNKCRLLFKVDGQTLYDREFVREGDRSFKLSFERDWAAGEHNLAFEIIPLGPEREQKRLLRLRLNGVTVRGPLEKDQWVQPEGYAKFFPKPVPSSKKARRAYAGELLGNFATRAFRRPVDAASVDRLVAMAEGISALPGSTFEAGVAQAMVAVLASPRFIFREEEPEPLRPGQAYPLVDEFALASRLSYFLWSSMPDDELFRLAGQGKLRASLPAQIDRLLKDPRGAQLVRNFTGQWLQARDIASVQINAVAVFLREHPDPAVDQALDTFRSLNRIPEEKRTPAEVEAFAKARTTFFGFVRAPKPQLSGELREAMRQETELDFAYLLKEDRSVLELIESDYTFLNEELAKHYGIPGVTGPEMRKVALPAGSPRGGVLTQGTVLSVTSNPSRTSPVKRGVFILDAILGTRPAPPPPNIPALEDAASKEELRQMTLRDTLALHAKDPLCRSCHNRMDPLGLALENFNAMGAWRETELNRPVEPAGKLITGESFANIRELKHIIATRHKRDYYYCLSEKLLTYALGRGLEYYDTETLDQLVAQLDAAGGRPSALLRGIVQSAPFQQRRQLNPPVTADQSLPRASGALPGNAATAP